MRNIGVSTHSDREAQQQSGGLLQQTYMVKPKAAMVQEFETAYVEHLAWHRQQNDSWIWETQQIVSGEYFGQYIVITPDHSWADFDNPCVPLDEHRAHFFSAVGQYMESISSSFWILLPKVSRFRETQEPFSILSSINFHLYQGKTDEFLHAVEKVYKAVEKTGWPSHYFWAAQVTGDQQPTYTLVFTPQNWAGLAPPEESIEDLLVEAYGVQEADAILKAFDETVKSQSSQISVDRPDLRYFPGESM